MVVNSITSKLMEIGFTEYEARAYVSLIGTNPATAYEVARISGIPTSKIYEVIARLLEKRVVSPVTKNNKKRYIPVDPGEFIENKRNKIESTLDTLKNDLNNLNTESDVSYIWNVHEYDYLLSKAGRMVESAESNILISGWDEEISCMEDLLKEKKKKGVKIAIVHFGKIKIDTGQIFQHPIEDTIYAEKGGRGFVLIIDSREALMGTVMKNNRVEGAWSMNNGFVTLAEDYIKHDVYIMKIIRRFDKMLIKKFGKNYIKLRDIYNDREEK